MLGGVGGSKLYFAIDVSIREGYPFLELLLARAGITWYGGLMGGALAGHPRLLLLRGQHTWVRRFCCSRRWPWDRLWVRVGCFLVGDDYGKVTDVPWAVTFPQGAPPTLDWVHPNSTLRGRLASSRRGFSLVAPKTQSFPSWRVSGMLNGAGRIVIEHWRVNQEVALGFHRTSMDRTLVDPRGIHPLALLPRAKAPELPTHETDYHNPAQMQGRSRLAGSGVRPPVSRTPSASKSEPNSSSMILSTCATASDSQNEPIFRAIFYVGESSATIPSIREYSFQVVSLHERTHSNRVVDSLINRSFACHLKSAPPPEREERPHSTRYPGRSLRREAKPKQTHREFQKTAQADPARKWRRLPRSAPRGSGAS